MDFHGFSNPHAASTLQPGVRKYRKTPMLPDSTCREVFVLSRLAEAKSVSKSRRECENKNWEIHEQTWMIKKESKLSKPSQPLASQNGRPGSRVETLIRNVDKVVPFNNDEIQLSTCLFFAVSVLTIHEINFETCNLTIQLVTILLGDSTSFAEHIKSSVHWALSSSSVIKMPPFLAAQISPGILLQSLLANVWQNMQKPFQTPFNLCNFKRAAQIHLQGQK